MLQAMNTGHEGSLSTAHANSTRHVLWRLETMAMMSDVDLPAAHVRAQVAAAIDVIVQLARLRDGRRVVWEIAVIEGTRRGEPVVEPVFRCSNRGDGSVFAATGLVPSLVPSLRARGRATSGGPVRGGGRHVNALWWARCSGLGGRGRSKASPRSGERGPPRDSGRASTGRGCPLGRPPRSSHHRRGRGHCSAWAVARRRCWSIPCRRSRSYAGRRMQARRRSVVAARGRAGAIRGLGRCDRGRGARGILAAAGRSRYAAGEAEPPVRERLAAPRRATRPRGAARRSDRCDGLERWTPPTAISLPARSICTGAAGATCPPCSIRSAPRSAIVSAIAREVRSLTAQARLSAWILGLLPIGFFAFLWLTARDEIEGALATPVGDRLHRRRPRARGAARSCGSDPCWWWRERAWG